MKDALIKMHLAVFLWGFTGVLGRAIEMNAFYLVWYRMLLTVIFLLIFLRMTSRFQILSFKEILRFAGIGCIIAIHWVLFYGSIKTANASIALVCLATAGIFTAILEPLVLKSKFNYLELLIGFFAFVGMGLIYTLEIQFALGIALGIGAALLSSVFTIFNKKLINNYKPNLVAFYEIGSGLLFLSILIPFIKPFVGDKFPFPSNDDWKWLIILSLFCTVVGQVLALSALKKLSSFTAVLMVNLEPVYGIFWAFYFYKENEELGKGFWIGIIVIATSVLWHNMQMSPASKNKLKSLKSLLRK